MENEESILTDILYRTLFWSILAYILNAISENMTEFNGEFLARASQIRPNSDWPNLLAMMGIILAPIVMYLKEFQLMLAERNINSMFINKTHYFLSKVSADLMLVLYGAMSFLIGWGFYLFVNYDPTFEDYLKIGILSPAFVTLMLFVAFFSAFVKVEANHTWFERWCSFIVRKYRLIIYGVCVVIGIIYFAA